ncbi:2'-5' RNA ligase family protein [Clostridium sp. MSJ-4]|uniref:2'-5' RNA ligase family protein n=1 Tax=Clostridium simiarum TaxID=2841506 RepID=A0ABS6F3Y8_9CLOT|nr:2'-5' RNA ligase family protein [Clostridium simiarum]MBU5593219.1 2'-5' RNA ligase family protein [Clostridium simiarum]
MKRYVIVCLIHGEAQEFHEKLVGDVCSRFNFRPQKLPMHITLKAPFEIEDVSEIYKITEDFCSHKNRFNFIVKDFGHFRDNVIFMDIPYSKELSTLHKDYIKRLKGISNLQWSKNEGENTKFHCTIVSRRISHKFKEAFDYVNNYSPEFNVSFDNISIMEYNFETFKWDLYKQSSCL